MVLQPLTNVFRTNISLEQSFTKPVLIYGSQVLTNNAYPWTWKVPVSLKFSGQQVGVPS